jgi:hypothetical protein
MVVVAVEVLISKYEAYKFLGPLSKRAETWRFRLPSTVTCWPQQSPDNTMLFVVECWPAKKVGL